MYEPSKFDAVKALCPNAEFVVRGETLEFIKANGDTEPSDSAITAKLAELKTDYANKEYQRKREPEYLHVKEQLDQLYHDMTAGKLDATGEWHKTIKAVKDKYPK